MQIRTDFRWSFMSRRTEEPEVLTCLQFAKIHRTLEPSEREERLWQLLQEFQGRPFFTAKGLEFTYQIHGGEMFVDRKTKSITRSTVMTAYRKALEQNCCVSGPKKLGTFGASYLYPVFLWIGIISC